VELYHETSIRHWVQRLFFNLSEPVSRWGLGLSWRFLLWPGRCSGGSTKIMISWTRKVGAHGTISWTSWRDSHAWWIFSSIFSMTSMSGIEYHQILLTYKKFHQLSDSELGRHVKKVMGDPKDHHFSDILGKADSPRVKSGSAIFRNTHVSWHGKRTGLWWMHELGCTGFGLYDEYMNVSKWSYRHDLSII